MKRRMGKVRVLVHIVSWNSAAFLSRCIESTLSQEGFSNGDSLQVHVTDNASGDDSESIARGFSSRGVSFSRNSENLGFCAAHNQGVHKAVVGGFDAILVLNPDVVLGRRCVITMVRALENNAAIGSVTPKLLRAHNDLSPVTPPVVDAAGMILYPSLRHFDRGSGVRDIGQFEQDCFVFGGTGACLLISTACAWSVAFPYSPGNDTVDRLYPQLMRSSIPRVQLFDEAFFAYREDADLAWRMRRLGWKCRYVATAVAYHVRVVVPERREHLPPVFNRYGVRNRFLLQMNNWSWSCGVQALVWGVLVRNILVIAGVLLRERTSLVGLKEALRLLPRALRNRRVSRSRIREIFNRVPARTLSEFNEGLSMTQQSPEVWGKALDDGALAQAQVVELLKNRVE
jgi:GT2 family glycosyltransferase